jgi:predicted negative regulator of RcsB-dependent stress response
LAEGIRDARLLWHAGEIALANGDREAAQRAFKAAQPSAASLTPGERARLDRRLGGNLAQTP